MAFLTPRFFFTVAAPCPTALSAALSCASVTPSALAEYESFPDWMGPISDLSYDCPSQIFNTFISRWLARLEHGRGQVQG